jgi:hypothetical protein
MKITEGSSVRGCTFSENSHKENKNIFKFMLLEHGKYTAMHLVNFKCVKTHFQYSTGFLNLICTVQYATKITIELRTQAVKFLMLLNPCLKNPQT